MSKLNQLPAQPASSKKRLGRGYSSGVGHQCSRGQKGSGARKSAALPLWFEGGQLPLTKRMPMIRGKSRLKVVRPVMEVNLSSLEKMKADKITLDTLKLENVIGARFARAKIIATGKITRSVQLTGLPTTPAAKKAIEAAGGSVTD